MKAKTAIVILVLLSLGLLAGLLYRHNIAVTEKRADEDRIRYLSNQWTETSAKLSSQVDVNNSLTTSLQAKSADLEKNSTQLSEVRSTLGKTETEVKMTKEQLEATKVEVSKRDARIAELENQNVALDKQAGEMKNAITDLESKINDTQKKLAASEGDREFLLKELKRLQAEKAELERKFTDLVVLREQVKKLKEELAISRRLEWIRKGLYGASEKKGAELLQKGFPQPGGAPKTNTDLNVELKRDGSATIVPPPAPAPAEPPKQ